MSDFSDDPMLSKPMRCHLLPSRVRRAEALRVTCSNCSGRLMAIWHGHWWWQDAFTGWWERCEEYSPGILLCTCCHYDRFGFPIIEDAAVLFQGRAAIVDYPHGYQVKLLDPEDDGVEYQPHWGCVITAKAALMFANQWLRVVRRSREWRSREESKFSLMRYLVRFDPAIVALRCVSAGSNLHGVVERQTLLQLSKFMLLTGFRTGLRV